MGGEGGGDVATTAVDSTAEQSPDAPISNRCMAARGIPVIAPVSVVPPKAVARYGAARRRKATQERVSGEGCWAAIGARTHRGMLHAWSNWPNDQPLRHVRAAMYVLYVRTLGGVAGTVHPLRGSSAAG